MDAIERFYADHDSADDDEEDIEVEEYVEEFFVEDDDGDIEPVSYICFIQ